ncbi:hypothetical protein [Mycolicibacterium doricum]|nr:hypothetical protein [Mycolicibacterium doricum]MCV7268794.1 hypothetical protein [Mycolicibacterium doricum]
MSLTLPRLRAARAAVGEPDRRVGQAFQLRDHPADLFGTTTTIRKKTADE